MWADSERYGSSLPLAVSTCEQELQIDHPGQAQNEKEQHAAQERQRPERLARRKPAPAGQEQPQAEDPHDAQHQADEVR